MTKTPNPPITFFHYSFSPWSQKITNYLNLRGIPYQSCDQPVTMPRPDLKALGVSYRRIPVMAIGRDIYCDTLIMFEKLRELYPYKYGDNDTQVDASDGRDLGLERLLEKWTDVVVFKYAANAIPSSVPLLNDKNFTDDRKQLWGREWTPDHQASLRPEALTALRAQLEFLEHTLLADGREWIQGGNHITLADIHAAWIFVWLGDMPDGLPDDIFGPKVIPKVRAWFERYKKAVADAAKKNEGNVTKIDGAAAVKQISEGPFGEPDGKVDPLDPTGLKQGEMVEGWPIDTGYSHRDSGKLVALTAQEAVIGSKAENGVEIRVHHPRWQFAVERIRN